MVLKASISLEFYPPHNPISEQRLWAEMQKLELLRPTFISVTYGASGSARLRSRKFLETLKAMASVPTSAHLTCVGRTRDEIDNLARKWWATGIKHIIALRGDSPKGNENYHVLYTK